MLTGFVIKYFGYPYAFLLAGLFLLLAAVIFLKGLKLLRHDIARCDNHLPKRKLLGWAQCLTWGIALLLIAGLTTLIMRPDIMSDIIDGAGILITLAVLTACFCLNKQERNKMLVCVILIAFSIAFLGGQ